MLREPQRFFEELAVGLENELDHAVRILDHSLGRRQIAGRADGVEGIDLMLSVAEGLVLGVPAPAQRDHLAACQPEFPALGVVDGKVPLDANRPIIVYRDFRRHQWNGSRRGARTRLGRGAFTLSRNSAWNGVSAG